MFWILCIDLLVWFYLCIHKYSFGIFQSSENTVKIKMLIYYSFVQLPSPVFVEYNILHCVLKWNHFRLRTLGPNNVHFPRIQCCIFLLGMDMNADFFFFPFKLCLVKLRAQGKGTFFFIFFYFSS